MTKQVPVFNRKVVETRYKLIDFVRELKNSNSEVLIFEGEDKKPRLPTDYELESPIRANGFYLVRCQNNHITNRRVDNVMIGRSIYSINTPKFVLQVERLIQQKET